MPSLHFSLVRALLRHKELYNDVLFPYFGTLQPYGLNHILRNYQCLLPYILNSSDGRLLKFEESIQKAVCNGESPSLALNALSWLTWMDKRLTHLSTDSILNVNYKYSIGEISEIAGSRERVVIAVRFPVFMTDNKYQNSEILGFLDQPWYIVIPPYGQYQETKEKIVPELLLQKVRYPVSVGYNPRLPVFFEGYDMNKSVYVPKKSIGEKINTERCAHV